ncbi:MAG: PAS domain-containing protein [Thermodesulfovibrionales bacterium]
MKTRKKEDLLAEISELRTTAAAFENLKAEHAQLRKELQQAHRLAQDEKDKTDAILQAIGDAISIQDRDFRVLYQNNSHKDLVGEHIGEYCYRAYANNETVCPDCALVKVFADGRTHRLEKNRVTDKGMLHVEIIASPLRDSIGITFAGIEAIRDISVRKKAEKEREALIGELQQALERINTLKGLLPICAWCKKVRDDKGYWNRVEDYIEEHSNAAFTHGICPECLKKTDPEVYETLLRNPDLHENLTKRKNGLVRDPDMPEEQ